MFFCMSFFQYSAVLVLKPSLFLTDVSCLYMRPDGHKETVSLKMAVLRLLSGGIQFLYNMNVKPNMS